MLDEDFIHQHPFMTTAAALGVGLLLGPVGLSFLAPGDTGNAEQKKAGAKKAKRKKTSAGTKDPDFASMFDEDFIHQHPFMTTAAALGVGLLLGPVALSFLAPGDAGNAEQKKAGAKKAKRKKTSAGTKDPDSTGMLDEDFIHQHPFMTTAAALGVGLLLGPVALSFLAPGDTGNAEQKKAGAEKAKGKKTSAGTKDPDFASMFDEDFIHQHPFMTTAAALGVGLLLGPVALSFLAPGDTGNAEQKKPAPKKQRVRKLQPGQKIPILRACLTKTLSISIHS